MRLHGAICALALAAFAATPAACTNDVPVDDGPHAAPAMPEAKDFKLVVEAASPTVKLGDDLVFKVRVENHGDVKAAVNVPRLARDSVIFKVRGAPFDVAWLDPARVKESPTGAEPDAAETKEIAKGEAAVGEIRTTAALCGKFVFSPVYQCQALGEPLTAEPVTVEVVPDPAGSQLGVRLVTSHGTIDAKLRADIAFQTATAYATLVKRGFFEGVRFHRVIQGFMAQGGDPQGAGWGGPGYVLRRELHGKLVHTRGVFSMARQQRPDTAGSQFFIMFRDAPELDKLGYTTFGEMISGNDTLARIEALGADGTKATPGGSEAPKEPISIIKASLLFLK